MPFVCVGICTAQRAAFAPGAVAVGVVLLLPDRAGVLDRFDHLPAGAEGFVAVRCAGGDDDGKIADREPAFRMRDVDLQAWPELRMRLRGDRIEAAQREWVEQVV